jgi:hypothetical protein
MAELCVFLRDGQCRVVCVSNYHPGGQGQYAESIKKFFKTLLFPNERKFCKILVYTLHSVHCTAFLRGLASLKICRTNF